MNTKGTLPPKPPRRNVAGAPAPRRRPVQRRASSRRAIVGLFALALLALAAGLTAGRCAGTPHTAAPAAYTSPYDWEGLERTGDRLAYYENGELRSDLGVDVSSHQGAIDWPAVAADGVDFAIVRAGNRGYTEGALYADERFSENVDGAEAAGLATGVYFFSQAVTPDEAREEADFVLGLLAGRPLDLPVAFDHEPVSDETGRANHLAGTELAACARAFCERIEHARVRQQTRHRPVRRRCARRPPGVVRRVRRGRAHRAVRLRHVAVHEHRHGGRHIHPRGPEHTF